MQLQLGPWQGFWPKCGQGLLLLSLASPALADPLRLCVGSGSPWPPFSYFQRDEQGPMADTLAGTAVDQIKETLAEAGIGYQVSFLPWSRVIYELTGAEGVCDLSWNASYSDERAQHLLYSHEQYRTELGYFYLDHSPWVEELDIGSAYCGINGYNYQPYNIPANEMLLVGSIAQVLRMQAAGRCHIFPSEIEPIYGGAELGMFELPTGLSHQGLGIYKSFHVVISRRHPDAYQLQALINQRLQQDQDLP